MSVAMNTFSILFNNRVISDIELKIKAVDNRMLRLPLAVESGELSLLQAHVIEKELLGKKHDLEAEQQSRKNILERSQKEAKDNIKKSFTINVSA